MTEQTHIVEIPRERMGEMLPHVGPHLLRGAAAEGEPVSIKDCFDDIVAGRMQVWAIMSDEKIFAGFVTSVVTQDGRRLLDVYGLGGDGILQWGHDLSETMAGFARANACEAVVFSGRKALQRTYTDVKIVGERAPGVFIFERAVK